MIASYTARSLTSMHTRKRSSSQCIRRIIAFTEKVLRHPRVFPGSFPLPHFRWLISLGRADMSSPSRREETLTLACQRKLTCVSHPPKEIVRTQIITYWGENDQGQKCQVCHTAKRGARQAASGAAAAACGNVAAPRRGSFSGPSPPERSFTVGRSPSAN